MAPFPWASSLPLTEPQFPYLSHGNKQPGQQSGKNQKERRKPHGNCDMVPTWEQGSFKNPVLAHLSPTAPVTLAMPSFPG